MTQTETLIAALTAVGDARCFTPTEDADDARYFDWSTRTEDGGYVLEVGDGAGDAVQVEMTVDELRRLHTALTIALLAEQAAA